MSTTRINKKTARAVQKLEDDRLAKLLNERRFCYIIPIDAFIEGFGYRVSIAIENEQGHYPTGDLRALEGDYSDPATTMPWFWGMTLKEAEAHCQEMNGRLGYTPLEAARIIASTMGGKVR